jgi:HisA/HisF family protein
VDVIPVLDVMGGRVVRALKGERANYRPIETALAATSDPCDVARGLRNAVPFKRAYIADLDGIQGRGRDGSLVNALRPVLPDTEFWIDAGTGTPDAVRAVLSYAGVSAVVGTESLVSAADWKNIRAEMADRVVLSLDFKGGAFIGPPDVLQDETSWPARVIVMTLDSIGADGGPDVALLASVIARAAQREVYAAGGVRDRSDLEALHKAGAGGALISSALHAGKISADDLFMVAGR